MKSPVLSVMIATLSDRKDLLSRLMGVLSPQCDPAKVEVLFLEDDGKMPLGQKRQILLERAAGDYVCVVDDDDLVSTDYVTQIIGALSKTPDATHCSLRGVLRSDGKEDVPFEHSSRYKTWEEVEGMYIRSPNHLNPVRRDLALQVGFKSEAWAEDFTYSMRLVAAGTLVKEAWIDPVIYYYMYRDKPSTDAMKAVGYQ